MKYCPDCCEEYEDFVDTCPECGADLVCEIPRAGAPKLYEDRAGPDAPDKEDIIENVGDWRMIYMGGGSRGMDLVPDLLREGIKNFTVRFSEDETKGPEKPEKRTSGLNGPGEVYFRIAGGEHFAKSIFGKTSCGSCGGDSKAVGIFVHKDDFAEAHRILYGIDPADEEPDFKSEEDLSDYDG